MSQSEVRHISEWRAKYGETLQQFAQRLDVSITSLFNWEKGAITPQPKSRRRVAERLALRQDQVTYGEPPTKKAVA